MSKSTTWRAALAFAVVAGLVRFAVKKSSDDTRVVDPAALARILASASAAAASRAAPPDAGDAGEARAAFAEEIGRAAKEATPGLTVRFVSEGFLLEWEKGDLRGEYYLERTYREYTTLPVTDRASFVRKRAASIGVPLVPSKFVDANAKLVPVVRERISYEVGRIMASPKPHVALHAEPPHVVLTDDLWGVLAYETEDQFVRIDAPVLKSWNVSFEKLWPEALARLEQRSRAGSTYIVDGVRELRFGDGNDSARVLLSPLLDKQPLAGGAVVAMPKEDVLLVAGADDGPALRALVNRLTMEWDLGNQNARVLRVGGGKTAPFVVEASNPIHERLADLRKSTEQRDERLQREALRRRLGAEEDAPFVASLFRVKHKDTNAEFSYVVHSEGVTSLLPRADYVVFKRVDVAKNTATTLGCAAWATVYPLMKDRWKETPLYPARWLATALPNAKELKDVTCDQPALRGDEATKPAP